jgi:hypothetical protein
MQIFLDELANYIQCSSIESLDKEKSLHQMLISFKNSMTDRHIVNKAATDFEINPASVDMYFRSVGFGSLSTSKLARLFKTNLITSGIFLVLTPLFNNYYIRNQTQSKQMVQQKNITNI